MHYIDEKVLEMGPLEEDKEEVRDDPYSLPSNFMWDEICLDDEEQVNISYTTTLSLIILPSLSLSLPPSLPPFLPQMAELYQLLYENYVEDDDNMFRFNYSKEFLLWALRPPGWKPLWYTGVRVASSRKLVGFISAVPALMRIKEQLSVACVSVREALSELLVWPHEVEPWFHSWCRGRVETLDAKYLGSSL